MEHSKLDYSKCGEQNGERDDPGMHRPQSGHTIFQARGARKASPGTLSAPLIAPLAEQQFLDKSASAMMPTQERLAIGLHMALAFVISLALRLLIAASPRGRRSGVILACAVAALGAGCSHAARTNASSEALSSVAQTGEVVKLKNGWSSDRFFDRHGINEHGLSEILHRAPPVGFWSIRFIDTSSAELYVPAGLGYEKSFTWKPVQYKILGDGEIRISAPDFSEDLTVKPIAPLLIDQIGGVKWGSAPRIKLVDQDGDSDTFVFIDQSRFPKRAKTQHTIILH
jgi:hypothetical protein